MHASAGTFCLGIFSFCRPPGEGEPASGEPAALPNAWMNTNVDAALKVFE